MFSIKIYTRTTCAPCQAVKMWLHRKGFSYTEMNVDESPELMDEVITQSGVMQVPMIVINDTVISGQNFALLSKALMV